MFVNGSVDFAVRLPTCPLVCNFGPWTKKPVFKICVQEKLNPACSTTQPIWNNELLHVTHLCIIRSRGRLTKVLISLRIRAGWSAPSLFACNQIRFPGAAYFSAEAIQKASGVKLWVALLEDFPFNVPNPIQLDTGVNEAIEKMGIANGNVFLAGHSLGGEKIQYIPQSQEFP